METEIIDKLYLELSQISKAKTKSEKKLLDDKVVLRKEIAQAEKVAGGFIDLNKELKEEIQIKDNRIELLERRASRGRA